MQYNALRRELAELLDGGEGERKPAVRRSRREDRIYATDLAGLPEGPERSRAAGRLRAAGWDVLDAGGWLEMRKTAPEPPEGWFEGPFGPEAGCCRALLQRHPERECEDPACECRLIKAGEEGRDAYERACREIHGEWAERLRLGQKLPRISGRYFSKEGDPGV